MKVIKRTQYELQHGEDAFPLEHEAVEDTAIVILDGDKARIGYLVDDYRARGNYWDENDSGTFMSFERHTYNYRPHIDTDEIVQLISDNPGRVFWVDKYEHSLVRFYRTGEALVLLEPPSTEPAQEGLYIPDQRWDVARGVALYIAPDDTPDPAKYADSVLEEYSDWCNGSIYGVVIEEYFRNADGNWESTDNSDQCWGYIGFENARQVLKEDIEN